MYLRHLESSCLCDRQLLICVCGGGVLRGEASVLLVHEFETQSPSQAKYFLILDLFRQIDIFRMSLG